MTTNTAPHFTSRGHWREAAKTYYLREVRAELTRRGVEQLPPEEFTSIRQQAMAEFARVNGPLESVPALANRRNPTHPKTRPRKDTPRHTSPRGKDRPGQVGYTHQGRAVPIKARTLRLSQVEAVVQERVSNHLDDLRACLVGSPERVAQILEEQRPQLTAFTFDKVMEQYTIVEG
ncbi:hypothetical protein ABIB48_002658 [Arthrobacter sp. UYCu511]|uniref:hypothetical protein n=1 Tax=Arthrobacter sp. UYCu511 TaxID=3156337 RepID=UPI003391C4ED